MLAKLPAASLSEKARCRDAMAADAQRQPTRFGGAYAEQGPARTEPTTAVVMPVMIVITAVTRAGRRCRVRISIDTAAVAAFGAMDRTVCSEGAGRLGDDQAEAPGW